MTSAILAQKLMTVKLGKEEFEKIKTLRAHNFENICKTIPYLKNVLSKQIRNKTCRLCLKPGETQIFGDQEFNYAAAVKNILQIEVKEDDGKPQHICSACDKTLRKAEQLKQTAEVTQWRLQQELEIVTNTLSEDETVQHRNHHGGYFEEQGSKMLRRWSCGKCRRTFDTQEAFAEHEKLSKCSVRRFICETCGVELNTMTKLKRHRLIHTGDLQFSCSQCPYRGRTKYAVLVHERAHTGIRTLACPQCPATFLNSSNLASHRRRHMPPAYHCHVCGRGFKFKEALRNHLATQHSTAKPHICNSCGKAFKTRKMICRHEIRIHNRPKMRPGVLPTYLRQQQEGST
ncbi:uncharacterized protein LOC142975116 [Anticarsia gemmatalis]|uniref:uncharacterized protein LOC142975116 n=1 Tax=Anticarsia gemmatalis TaxID=129554 RepID=UPI003F77636E